MQEKKQIKIELPELLYLCFWVLMLITKGLGFYDGQLAYKILLVISLGFILVKMCITKHTMKEWMLIGAMGLLSGLVYLVSKEKGIVICTVVVLAMKQVSVKRVFKIGMWTWGITMLVNVIYHLINLEASGYKVHEKLGLGHIFRWDLGFSHPNVLHISYLVLCAFIIYNIGERYNWKHIFFLMLGNMLVFLYSVSYTGVFVTTLYLGMMWYASIRKELNVVEYLLIGMIFPACILLSLLSPVLLPERIFTVANKIFSNRLVLAKYYLIPENIKLFGNNLERITTSMYTMDNAYVFTIIIYGIVVFAIMISMYFYLIHRYIKLKKKNELVMIVCFLIAGITEPFLFNTSFKNLTLVFIGSLLFENGKNEKEWSLLSLDKSSIEYNCQYYYDFLARIAKVWIRQKKRILLSAIVIGGISAGVYANNVNVPKAYVMPRVQVDIVSEETWYIDDVKAPMYQDMKILDYKDSETKMQIFDGNIILVEYIRGCISTFLLASGAVGCILLVVNTAMTNKKKL